VATDYRFSNKTANLQDNSMASSEAPEPFSAGKIARATLDAVSAAALATLNADRAPFTSLVLAATDEAGDIVMLLSQLAVHTRNLQRDPRASLLAVAPGGETGDPLAGARVTVIGHADREVDEQARARFLSRHPESAAYAAFADFGFWRLKIASAHLVAGFGRIVDLDRSALTHEHR
jgi:heme iron utilization protein